MPLSAGDRLGPYEILALVGAGGMGEVYRASDTRLDRIVAIKVSKTEFSERFEREAKAIAALNHSHICRICDVGPNYLVMEYIEGDSLKGPLPMQKALEYAAQIAGALDAAHTKKITHRDLKPTNILVTKSAGVKLIDFGLAKVEKPVAGDHETITMSLTGKGQILGTLPYMSPEQITGQEADARSDIFSFGLVLYEMLTGKRAFEGSTPASVMGAILERPAPSISDIAPATLDRVLKRCLEKDPENRWQTARDLNAALELARAAPERGADVTKQVQTRAAVWPWAFAGGLAVALLAPWHSPQPLDRPLIRLDVNLGPDAVPGVGSSVAISPDGTQIVFPIRGADGKQLLATRLLNQIAITPLPGTENGSNTFFSTDGRSIGFTADSKLKKMSLRGGTPVALSDVTAFRGASWAENGDIVANLNVVGGLQNVPASAGALHSFTNLAKHEVIHAWPQVLPGGNAVLFTASGTAASFEDANIEVVSFKTGPRTTDPLKAGDVKTLVSGGSFGRYLPTNGPAGHLVYLRQGVLYAVAFDPVRLQVQGIPEQILEDVAGSATNPFDVSRNGSFVYHPETVANQKWPIMWLDSSGKTEPLVTTPGNYNYPQFSPDGKRLALTDDTDKVREILVYDQTREALSRLTFTGGQNNSPVWSRDGEHLVFESRDAEGSRLNWVRADGSGETQVLLDSRIRAFPSGFSPDGRRLAYYQFKPDGDYDLWTLPLDISDPEHPKPGKHLPFLQTPAAEVDMAFSPDGRYVSYFSNETGKFEIYVRPTPGPDGKPGPGKWQVSTDGGTHTEWSTNGHELFYKGFDNRIMVTDYATTGGSFSSGKPRVWSYRQIAQGGIYRSFGLSPDGKRFAVFPMPKATAEDKSPGHVTFLLNFFDELRRRVPARK